jgi:hypothetical protein
VTLEVDVDPSLHAVEARVQASAEIIHPRTESIHAPAQRVNPGAEVEKAPNEKAVNRPTAVQVTASTAESTVARLARVDPGPWQE